MPAMYEIYEKHAIEYDELVAAEDYENNLQKELNQLIKDNETVLEIGTGTGRVTKLYAGQVKRIVCCDRSNHMLEKAKENLSSFSHKIQFQCLDTRNLHEIEGKFDLIIEGWAIGHTAIDEYEQLNQFLEKLFSDLKAKLSEGGTVVFIETLGTNVIQPTIPGQKLNEFYQLLENTYRMEKKIIRTDYRFKSLSEAKRILSFFFGEEMGKGIESPVVEEYTGIWIGKQDKFSRTR